MEVIDELEDSEFVASALNSLEEYNFSSPSQVQCEVPRQDNAQPSEFRCSHCGECHDVRDRPKYHRMHQVPPPPVYTEAQRAD